MLGKVRTAIVAALMVAGAMGVERAADAMANNSTVLRVAAQYKMVTGDTQRAVELLRRAEAKRVPPPAQPSSAHSHAHEHCAYSKS